MGRSWFLLGTLFFLTAQSSAEEAITTAPVVQRVYDPAVSGIDYVTPSAQAETPIEAQAQAPAPIAVPAPIAAAAPADPSRLAFGVGYPDLRLRGQLWGPLDGEFKIGLDGGVQAYAGRLYYSYARFGGLSLNLGGEGGWIALNGLDGLTGSGAYGLPFAGAQYQFARRWGVNLDAGPAFINLNAEGQSQSGMEWVISSALYLWLF